MKSRYSTAVWTFLVGPEKFAFYVHLGVLSPSYTLQALCQPGFREEANKTISLPHDDPLAFGQLLDYLYTGTLTTRHSDDDNVNIATKELATLYVMADKYLLPDLMDYIHYMISNLTWTKPGDKCHYFFKFSQHVFNELGNTNQQFATWFDEEAGKIIQALEGDQFERIDATIAELDPFAASLARLMYNQFLRMW